jgi:hypothetical protein
MDFYSIPVYGKISMRKTWWFLTSYSPNLFLAKYLNLVIFGCAFCLSSRPSPISKC